MQWRALAIAISVAATALSAPAHAFCGGIASVLMPIEFAQGSATVDSALGARVADFARAYGEVGREIDSFAVTAMGDLGEGPEFDAASPGTRAADKALAEARLAAVRDQLMAMGILVTDTRVRPTRQIFSDADRAANPMLNDRVRAGIFIAMRRPAAPVKDGRPVPLC